jgi:hypothetical protein
MPEKGGSFFDTQNTDVLTSSEEAQKKFVSNIGAGVFELFFQQCTLEPNSHNYCMQMISWS